MVTVLYLRLGVTVVYQPGLTHTAGRDQRHVTTIDKSAGKLFGLLHPVAKIFGGNITADRKGILDRICHNCDYCYFNYWKYNNYVSIIAPTANN